MNKFGEYINKFAFFNMSRIFEGLGRRGVKPFKAKRSLKGMPKPKKDMNDTFYKRVGKVKEIGAPKSLL